MCLGGCRIILGPKVSKKLLTDTKEDLLKKRAQEFRQFLEAMKTWGGMDIITIKPGVEATVKSMGDGYVTT
jgi:hypothetical protein